MQVIDPGHSYELAYGNTLSFIKRTNGVLVNEGTTNEEVIEVLLDRLHFLHKKLPCRENSLTITKLEEALLWLNHRTAKRLVQGIESTDTPHV